MTKNSNKIEEKSPSARMQTRDQMGMLGEEKAPLHLAVTLEEGRGCPAKVLPTPLSRCLSYRPL